MDLDETLVHAESFLENKIYDIVIDMAEQGERQDVGLKYIVLILIENWNQHQTLHKRILEQNGQKVRIGSLHERKARLC